MDGLRDFHKWSKSDRKKQVWYDIAYMWNVKYDTNELIYRTEIDHRHRKQTDGYKGERGDIN